MELALFGNVIKNLSYREALYILNTNNYDKTLKEFREGFAKLSKNDLIIKGPFQNFNINDEKKIDSYKNKVFIKAKGDKNGTNSLKDVKINIPLRNDAIGRNIKEKHLEPYFN